MLPDDRFAETLDALLSQRAPRSHSADTEPFAPLLAAADTLTPMRLAVPSPTFAQMLEERLLAHAERISQHDVTVPIPVLASQRREPMRRWGLHGNRAMLQAIAAVFLLAFGIGAVTLAAAANAAPGTPLYGLHRWEQGVRASLTTDPADRARLHLQYAEAALSAFDRAVARHSGDPTYTDSLTTLRSESDAAAAAIATLPSGATHDDLSARLASLQSRGQSDVRAALPALSWADRVTATTTLGALNAQVPLVTSAMVVHTGSDGRSLRVIVSGSGFESGAVLLVNGTPTGTVVSVSPTTLTAEIDSSAAPSTITAIGIGNPDDTASVTSVTTSHAGEQQHSQNTPPVPSVTPGSHDGSGKGGHGGNHGAQPTPTPMIMMTPTPTTHR